MMRKLFVSLFAAGLVSIAAPALAEPGVAASVSGVGNGAVLSGHVGLRGEGSAPTGVARVEMLINGREVASTSPDGMRTEASVSYGWDTNQSFSGGIALNGQYTITVRTVSHGGGSDSASVTVYVDNGAQSPSGISVDRSGNTVTVSWAPNPEPDIQRYRVERDSGSGFQTAGETQGTSFSESVGAGTHTYRVIAIRYSPSSDGGRASDPSAGATVTVEGATSGGSGSWGGSGSAGGSSSGGGVSNPFGGNKDGRGTGGTISNPFSSGTQGRKGIYRIGGKRFAFAGLPAGRALPPLPGTGGLPQIPRTEGMDWGSYEEELPYDLPSGTAPLATSGNNVAARSPWRVIPPDGLRWVAAGALALVTAALLIFLSSRLEDEEERPVQLSVVGDDDKEVAAA